MVLADDLVCAKCADINEVMLFASPPNQTASSGRLRDAQACRCCESFSTQHGPEGQQYGESCLVAHYFSVLTPWSGDMSTIKRSQTADMCMLLHIPTAWASSALQRAIKEHSLPANLTPARHPPPLQDTAALAQLLTNHLMSKHGLSTVAVGSTSCARPRYLAASSISRLYQPTSTLRTVL